ncbi:hypothetical protein U9M48_042163 [Paspalum notatum var. saurae]|uniref:Uncharacterized protein n=1 Tax=Paspalum notatum var. saurae TaxID=547442 RepID=A0AAQ3UWE8_PASNO
MGAASPLVQFATPPVAVDEELDADHDDDVPLQFRTVENILSSGQLFAVSAEEPGSLAQSEQDPSWRRTARHRGEPDLDTHRAAPGPARHRAQVKKDEHGAVVRHKARLVVKGYAQC